VPRPHSRAAPLIPQLQDWDDQDLEDLQAMIQGLLESRQFNEPIEIPTRADGSAIEKRGGVGHIELKMIPDKATGKQYGPYHYLRYRGISRKTGKMALLSVYLGKSDRAPAE
jgi:hypothetical protein